MSAHPLVARYRVITRNYPGIPHFARFFIDVQVIDVTLARLPEHLIPGAGRPLPDRRTVVLEEHDTIIVCGPHKSGCRWS